MAAPVLIKKYGNRRLYDTELSRYITLEELAGRIRGGAEVRVVDAKTNEDLTQGTLTQLILEGGTAARLLPVGLLTQLIRLGDDALGEFFSRYVTAALDLYLQARRGVQTLASYNPLAQLPLAAGEALQRLWMGTPLANPYGSGYASPPGYGPPPVYAPPPAVPPEPEPEPSDHAPADRARADDLAQLRRELDELKRSMQPAGSTLGRPGAKRKRRQGR